MAKKKFKSSSKFTKFIEKKISLDNKEIATVGVLTVGDMIYDLSRIDQRYIEGANTARPSIDLSSKFKLGAQNVKDLEEKGEAYLNKIHDVNYSGYTQEFVTHSWARSRGEEVELPKTFNQKGWDAKYNGQEYQIKYDSVDSVRRHRLENPDIPVRTDIETANSYKQKFTKDSEMVQGTVPKSITSDIVKEGKEASIELVENEELFNLGIDEKIGIAAFVPALKNLNYYLEGKTDVNTGVQNIIGDGLAISGGMALGASILGAVDPIAQIVGAIGGAKLGKVLWNKTKIFLFCEDEYLELEKSLKNYVRSSKRILRKNLKTFEKKSTYFKDTFGKEKYRSQFFKDKKFSGELFDYLIHRMRLEYKEKNDVLKKLDRTIDGNDFSPELIDKKKYEDFDKAEIHKIAADISQFNAKVGVTPEFVSKETKHLSEAISNYISAMQKRGI